MPSQQSEQTRGMLAAVAIVTAAGSLLCFRMIGNASALAARPVPAADMQTLSAFLTPLPESGAPLRPNSAGVPALRDPFARAAGTVLPQGRVGATPRQVVAAGKWVVSSILLEGSRRSAIVNNVWVNIGDGIAGGAKVTAIEPDHVVVTDAKGVRHIVSIQGGV